MSGPSPLCALKPKATAAPALMHFGDPDPPPDVEHEYETDDEPGHDEWIQMMEATPGGVAIEKDDAADADTVVMEPSYMPKGSRTKKEAIEKFKVC